jgi:hypothetical protein
MVGEECDIKRGPRLAVAAPLKSAKKGERGRQGVGALARVRESKHHVLANKPNAESRSLRGRSTGYRRTLVATMDIRITV